MSLDVETPRDLEEIGSWTGEAPLHLNVCFEEPTADDRNDQWLPDPGLPCDKVEVSVDNGEVAEFCADRDGLLVVLGEIEVEWHEEVERLLAALGCPVWAEATSGLRESAALVGLLRTGELPLPRKVLRIGGVPSLRLWRDLEANVEISVLSICRRPFSGLARPSRMLVVDSLPAFAVPTEEGLVADPTLFDGSALDRFPRSEPSLV
ncbi:MAG TPA: hypothetical protein PLA50_20630, partial [Bacteroidia bacterium]|nr:hypothetical protein [Bacteroidia bacterium]